MSPYLAELEPVTPSGRKLVALCEGLVEPLRAAASEHDLAASFPTASFSALREAGVTAAFVPEELGGLGLESIADWTASLSRLGRADASLALGLNMHLGVSRVFAQLFRAAKAEGQHAEQERYARRLRAVASGKLTACISVSEAGSSLVRPRTTATREGDGYRLDGHKLFASLSPAASLYIASVRIGDEEEGAQLGFAFVPAGTAGLEPQSNWDALGMRGSGSQSVALRECRVPLEAVQVVGPWGRWSPALLSERMLATIALLGVYLGIAERARELAVQAAGVALKARGAELEPRSHGVQQLLGELDIDLYDAQCVLGATVARIDAFLANTHERAPELTEAHARMRDFQCAKWIVGERAAAVVSRAMEICGGASFLSSHELSRLYRDVRAAAFMQPFSTGEARGYIGRVALGRAALAPYDGA